MAKFGITNKSVIGIEGRQDGGTSHGFGSSRRRVGARSYAYASEHIDTCSCLHRTILHVFYLPWAYVPRLP